MKPIAILAVVLVGAVALPSGARGDFGIDDFDLVLVGARHEIVTQAGEHPFALDISWDSNVSGGETEGRLRDLFLDLPPGLVADTTAAPRCTREDFAELDEGVNDCSDSTAVGIVATSFDEPGKWIAAPVFNLVPSEGAVFSLGFRVAGPENVVVDFGLSWDRPHRLLAVATDFPETIDLFGAKLQLWGVPGDPDHDGLRGQCGAYTTTLPPGEAGDFEFESLVGECPVSVAQRPFFTLPTSCEGPLATFYEALSWEDDVDFGGVLTHDEAGNPQGMTGCGSLAFLPLFDFAPTTEEAKSQSGLDFSLMFSDEGLTNPSGIAESTVRELILLLPEGMTATPMLTNGAGACTEADFAEEDLENASGEGCPGSSEIGTVEVETPLIAETTIEGTVHRAVPFANAAEDSPIALYVVLEDPALGILVTQAIGIEPDPETGQLVAFAEELPQLPFSDLHLNIEAAGGPLISPPLCGKYETAAGFVPRADDSLHLATSTFEIVSGPNEGPCPIEEAGADPKQTGGGAATPPQGASPAAAEQADPRRRRRCPKGKRRIRRHGKTRCVKRRPRKAKEDRGSAQRNL